MDPISISIIVGGMILAGLLVPEMDQPGFWKRVVSGKWKQMALSFEDPSTYDAPTTKNSLELAREQLEAQGLTPPGEPQMYYRGLDLAGVWSHIEPEISFSEGLVQDGHDIEYGAVIGTEPTGKKIPTGKTVVVARYIKQYDWVSTRITGWKKVGERQVGWKIGGYQAVERSVPGGVPIRRRIRGIEEFLMMNPVDRAIDSQLGFIQALTGQAMVRSWIHQVPHYVPDMEDILEAEWEPVWKPVWSDVLGPEMVPEMREIREELKTPHYRKRRKIIYMLVDNSGSIYAGDGYSSLPWTLRYQRGIQIHAIEKARAEDAEVWHRYFASSLHELQKSGTTDEDKALIQKIEVSYDMGGTDITRALYGVLEDLEAETFEEATVMIISDGQDSSLAANVADIVLRFMDAGVNVHAIMLGEDNEALRFCADKFQVIPEEGTISELVLRSIN